MNFTECDEFDTFVINQIEQLPTNAVKIASETRKDDRLGAIIKILEKGKSLQAYGYKSPEINYRMAGNCLTFEHRVVIPEKLKPRILEDLHCAHLGIVKMKALARSFVYWPGIDKDIERVAKSCESCAELANDPPKFREHHWHYSNGPWERIHVDYAGPFLGTMLLVVTDAYSKWIEVKVTPSSTSTATINILDELFATYGVPVTVVSDNGTCFASSEFKEFPTNVGVKYHKFTAPYHPSTNGQAERSVQTIKNALKSLSSNKCNLQKHLNLFLRQYRITPHSTTSKPPALLFMGRVFRTRLDLLLPQDLKSEMSDKQYMQLNSSFRTLEPMQNVYFLSNNKRMPKWLPGIVLNQLGYLHYEVLYEGKRIKRHIDQIRGNMNIMKSSDSKFKTMERRRSQIETENTNISDKLDEENFTINPSTQSSTPEQRPVSIDISSADFSTPRTGFQGFSSQEEEYNESGTELDNESNQSPKHDGGRSGNFGSDQQIPLRRSTRNRQPRILFSP